MNIFVHGYFYDKRVGETFVLQNFQFMAYCTISNFLKARWTVNIQLLRNTLQTISQQKNKCSLFLTSAVVVFTPLLRRNKDVLE